MGVAVESQEGIRPELAIEEWDRTHPSRGELLSGSEIASFDPICDFSSVLWDLLSRKPASEVVCQGGHDFIQLPAISWTIHPDNKEVRRVFGSMESSSVAGAFR